jgi:hypothetical protein
VFHAPFAGGVSGGSEDEVAGGSARAPDEAWAGMYLPSLVVLKETDKSGDATGTGISWRSVARLEAADRIGMKPADERRDARCMKLRAVVSL